MQLTALRAAADRRAVRQAMEMLMVPVPKETLEFLESLIQRAGPILASARTLRTSSYTQNDFVDREPFYEWMASSLSFLRRVFGSAHTHTVLFEARCSQTRKADLEMGVAILRAARTDLQNGFLSSLRTLVEAEVFSNFLEMSAHLLENGYKDPAASLTGAVLEDGLRRIAVKNDVTVAQSDDLQSLNTKLADAEIYNRLTQKRVKVWTDTRNHADHGQFDHYTIEVVREMLAGVTDFLDHYLGIGNL